MKINFTREDIFGKSGIYVIKNSINSRVYVGSSKNLYKRFNSHKSELIKGTHANKALQNFCIKHGIDKLTIEILELCEADKLINRENFFIKELKGYGHGFNCCSTAKNFSGIKISEETRSKMSEKRKLYIKNNPTENKERLNKGRKTLLLKYKSGELKPHNLGKFATEEAKHKMSIAKIGKKSKIDKLVWDKIREARKVKCSGEEHPLAKITEVEARQIKELKGASFNDKKELALKFKVSLSTIYDIQTGRSWANI